MTHANENEPSPTDRTAEERARATIISASEAIEPNPENALPKISLLGGTPRWAADTLAESEGRKRAHARLRDHARTAYQSSIDTLLEAVNREPSPEGETIAIDLITFDEAHWNDTEPRPQEKEQPVRNYSQRKPHLAIAVAVSTPVPILLSIEPLADISGFEAEDGLSSAKIVRELLDDAEEHVPVDTVLADRGFSTAGVVTELNHRAHDYIITAQRSNQITSIIEQLQGNESHEPAVAADTIFTDVTGSEAAAHVVISSAGAISEPAEHTPFFTNKDAALENPEAMIERHKQRWDAEHLCWLFRRRILEKSIYQTGLPLRQCWSISAEINAYRLATHWLSENSTDEASSPSLTFAQFQEVLKTERYRRAMEAAGEWAAHE